MIKEETYLKGKILTCGVAFSQKALEKAIDDNAKIQNMVYNAPVGAGRKRPQELAITHIDGYETVVSCVAPNGDNEVFIDVIENNLVAYVEGIMVDNVKIEYVKEPEYYRQTISNGELVRKYVSACGYDELNIMPWKGCGISKGCLFCGVNVIAPKNDKMEINAHSISDLNMWEEVKEKYVDGLLEALEIAVNSGCYDEHMHVILISGDLKNSKLDLQSEIYSYISSKIKGVVSSKATEGIVAVMMPPNNEELLYQLKESGIDKVVFNLEVGTEELFNKYCPGKKDIGYDHIMRSLIKATEIFGIGNSWSNFVLGLEPVDELLTVNRRLAKAGIVPSANVLHMDTGNRLDCNPPAFDIVIYYFYELAQILKEYRLKPYYCSKALRTSLSNEAYDNRIVL